MIRLHFRNSLFIPLLHNMMDRNCQTLTQRVKELAERYGAMESKVRPHLERMGFAWQ
jgi:hypothetical protein